MLTEELVQVPTCEKPNESRVSMKKKEIKPVTKVFVQTSSLLLLLEAKVYDLESNSNAEPQTQTTMEASR